MAQEKGLKLFSSNIIYHLFDMFKKHTEVRSLISAPRVVV
jgi:hypothetical protein